MIPQHIQYKVISTTFKLLQNNAPSNLRSLITIQPDRSTRSSDCVTLRRPTITSRLKLTNRSIYHMTPSLWNTIPNHLRCPSPTTQSTPSYYPTNNSTHNSKLISFTFLTHHNHPLPLTRFGASLFSFSYIITTSSHHHLIRLHPSSHSLLSRFVGVSHNIRTVALRRTINHLRLILVHLVLLLLSNHTHPSFLVEVI